MKYATIEDYNEAQDGEDKAICEMLMREIDRHLPEAESKITGCFSSAPRSNNRVNFSPTTDPIDPPMKRNRKAPNCTGR